MRRPSLALLFVAGALLAWGVAAAQQQVKRGSVAVITADEMETSYETGHTEMMGNVRVHITGGYDATMTASRVSVEADLAKGQVLSLAAQGPVTFDVLTTDEGGKQSRVVARCRDEATFSEQTMVVQLKGEAHAEVTGMPRAEGVESARYDGDSMSINLKARTIKLTRAHLEVEMAPQGSGAGAGAKP